MLINYLKIALAVLKDGNFSRLSAYSALALHLRF